ncbi:hypothetical protein QUA23_11575 [Microcoleus sp. Pol1C5]
MTIKIFTVRLSRCQKSELLADRYTKFNLFSTIDETTRNSQKSSVALPITAL